MCEPCRGHGQDVRTEKAALNFKMLSRLPLRSPFTFFPHEQELVGIEAHKIAIAQDLRRGKAMWLKGFQVASAIIVFI